MSEITDCKLPIANKKLGLIAGNGNMPLRLLEVAVSRGSEVVVAAIKEETSPEIESRGAKAVHWISLGELGKLIDTFKREGVNTAVMAGQVKHKQIFSTVRPDWKLAKVLLSLGRRNTDSLLGAVAKVLEEEGIRLIDSTSYLEPLLARAGLLTQRPPNEQEHADMAYGREVAQGLAPYDIGQTVVIAAVACVAIEAMEGTDATIARAGEIMKSLEAEASTFSRSLTVLKLAKPNQDMRFDVPIIGVKTIETMKVAGATCLAIDAGKCLLIDGERVVEAADRYGITVIAE